MPQGCCRLAGEGKEGKPKCWLEGKEAGQCEGRKVWGRVGVGWGLAGGEGEREGRGRREQRHLVPQHACLPASLSFPSLPEPCPALPFFLLLPQWVVVGRRNHKPAQQDTRPRDRTSLSLSLPTGPVLSHLPSHHTSHMHNACPIPIMSQIVRVGVGREEEARKCTEGEKVDRREGEGRGRL